MISNYLITRANGLKKSMNVNRTNAHWYRPQPQQAVYRSVFIVYCLLLIVNCQAQPVPKKPAKEGEIDNKEIDVVKARKVNLPPANRIVTKIPAPPAEAGSKPLTYDFQDRKLTVGDPKITPGILSATTTAGELPPVFHNYVKLGGGNYNTFYAEGFGSLNTQPNYGVEVSARHLSSGIGPVDGKNSSQSDTKLNVTGRYQTDVIKFTGEAGYQRAGYNFYATGRRPDGREINADSIRQRLNTAYIGLGLENVVTDQAVDYSLKTRFTGLSDLYLASETDWATNFRSSLSLSGSSAATSNAGGQLLALLSADAYLSQRTDGEADARNLFRIAPGFRYRLPWLNVTASVRVVSETDKRLDINTTRAFPVIDVDVVPDGNIHFFAGIDGDVNRNTLRSLLGENKWLSRQVVLLNTVKTYEVYGGSKGEIGSGFHYEGRVSYAQYRNLHTFNNSWPDSSRFFVLYDGGQSNLLTVSGLVTYQAKIPFRSSLKVDVYRYGLDRLAQPWGLPTATATWTNSYAFDKKLFVTADFYLYTGIKNQNFTTGVVTTLQPITDLNLKIDYLLGQQFSAFVSLNNLTGRQYERYQYYKQQGTNFLAGVGYTF